MAGFVMPSKRPSIQHAAGGLQVRLLIPIDPDRDTRWTACELAYGLLRDAWRRLCTVRDRRAWGVVFWAVRGATSAALGAAADHRLHLVDQILHRFG